MMESFVRDFISSKYYQKLFDFDDVIVSVKCEFEFNTEDTNCEFDSESEISLKRLRCFVYLI